MSPWELVRVFCTKRVVFMSGRVIITCVITCGGMVIR